MRPNSFARIAVALGIGLAAAAAGALPGAVSSAEAALIRAAIGNETVVGETHKAIELPCGPSAAEGSHCQLDAEFSRGIAEANAQRGYLQCSALGLARERCIRRRELQRRVFHRFPAVIFSRPAVSADGNSAVVYRTRYANAEHGTRHWVFLVRGGVGEPWTVALEQLASDF